MAPDEVPGSVPGSASRDAAGSVGAGTRTSSAGEKPARRMPSTRAEPYARSDCTPDAYRTPSPATRPMSSATAAPGSETWPVMSTIPREIHSRFHDQATVRRRERGPAVVSSPASVASDAGIDSVHVPLRSTDKPRTRSSDPNSAITQSVRPHSSSAVMPAAMTSRICRPSRRAASSVSTATGAMIVTRPSSTATGNTSSRVSRVLNVRTSCATPEVVPCA